MEINLEEFTGLLFRDVKSNYDPDNIHRDKLFFSTDTKELLLNGEPYGKNNLFVLNDIGLLSNESGQRIKEIIGSFKDVTQAITDRKIFITTMGVGITPVIVKQQSVKVSFTVFYYDTYNTSQIKHRTLIINSDGREWTNIESIIDDEIIRISDLNLNYNSENKIISIKKENNDIITQIDATDFIKDGMINTVELIENPDGRPVGTYLVITFNTDAGKEPIYLDITTLIGIYTAGQGIDISNNTISIKIDPSSEKYISVTKDGLKIVGIDEKLNFTPTTKINKLIGEIQITNELEHDKQELFDLFGVTNVNDLFSLSPETIDKYFEDVEGNRLKYFISGGMGGGTLTISYENVIYNDSILSDVILISASKDNYGLYNEIISITNSKKESNIAFYYVGDIFSLSTSSTSAEIEKILGSVNDFTNAYEKGKLIVCRVNSGDNNDTISPILFQYYNDTIKIKMIYAGLGYNPSSPDDCIEIILNKSSNTWRVTEVTKQKLDLPDNLAYVEEVSSEEPSEQLELIADKAIKDFNGNVISNTYITNEKFKSQTSEVYTNLSAIQSSGETNPNKIYIDGETAQPYIYKDGKFVPFKGGENNSIYISDEDILYAAMCQDLYVFLFDKRIETYDKNFNKRGELQLSESLSANNYYSKLCVIDEFIYVAFNKKIRCYSKELQLIKEYNIQNGYYTCIVEISGIIYFSSFSSTQGNSIGKLDKKLNEIIINDSLVNVSYLITDGSSLYLSDGKLIDIDSFQISDTDISGIICFNDRFFITKNGSAGINLIYKDESEIRTISTFRGLNNQNFSFVFYNNACVGFNNSYNNDSSIEISFSFFSTANIISNTSFRVIKRITSNSILDINNKKYIVNGGNLMLWQQ